jgi:hypothetical protein
MVDDGVRDSILHACRFDWSSINPAIFASLYQLVLSKKERRNFGAYSTTEANILKVLNDLFLDDLRNELAVLSSTGARRREALVEFRKRLSSLVFFDPACGCGNFLSVAYREVRQLELDVLRKLKQLGDVGSQFDLVPNVSLSQFYGIERRDYSIRIAEAALWITDHLANVQFSNEIGIEFFRIPLDEGPRLAVGDALSFNWREFLPSNRQVVIFSNPPYKGAKLQSDVEREQIRSLARLGGSGGTLDYSCGWIVKAAELAGEGAKVGFVIVNSVLQGEQVGQLWPIVSERYGLCLRFAHQSFKWLADTPGDANVQVVVLGFKSSLLGGDCFLYRYPTAISPPSRVECPSISPYLIDGRDLTQPNIVVRETSRPISIRPAIRTGTKPIDGGYYILDEVERVDLLRREPDAAEFVRPFIGGDEFLAGTRRYILVLESITPRQLNTLPIVRSLVQSVRQYRAGQIAAKNGRGSLQRPTEPALVLDPFRFHIRSIPERPFLVIPEVSSERREYVPIGWLDPPAIPSNLVKFIGNATLTLFALLTSAMHMAWLRTVGGRLEGRYRYSKGLVYNTFPFPEGINSTALDSAAQSVLDVRRKFIEQGCSLSDLYDVDSMPSTLRIAHRNLDVEVDRMYVGTPVLSADQRAILLLNRYHQITSKTDD